MSEIELICDHEQAAIIGLEKLRFFWRDVTMTSLMTYKILSQPSAFQVVLCFRRKIMISHPYYKKQVNTV